MTRENERACNFDDDRSTGRQPAESPVGTRESNSSSRDRPETPVSDSKALALYRSFATELGDAARELHLSASTHAAELFRLTSELTAARQDSADLRTGRDAAIMALESELQDVRETSAELRTLFRDHYGTMRRELADRDPELRAGIDEGSIHSLFDREWYLSRNADVRACGIDPLTHYLQHGAAEGRDPNPLFDSAWYLDQNPDVARAGVNPLVHYVLSGSAEGRDPGPHFDQARYLVEHPYLAVTDDNPLAHYLEHGTRSGRPPFPTPLPKHPSSRPAPMKYDVVILADQAFDASAEASRRLAVQLAEQGHRVFHLMLGRAMRIRIAAAYSVSQIADNVLQIRFAADRLADLATASGSDGLARLQSAIAELSEDWAISDAVVLAQSRSTAGLAATISERFLWPRMEDDMDGAGNAPAFSSGQPAGAAAVDAGTASGLRTSYDAFNAAAWRLFSPISIVIVSFNTRHITKSCIESVLRNTAAPRFELIVVDNASSDGTPAMLRQLEKRHPHLKLILNSENRGFAAANNQGLAIANGDILVLMNSDVVVPPHWMRGMLRCLRDPDVGLAGPVTNSIGNEARIAVPYQDLAGLEDFARHWMHAHVGHAFDIAVLAMYCLAMTRKTWVEIGHLDEQFGLGWFEDDDYSNRVRDAGYRIVCTEESFVHHFGQSSFKTLTEPGQLAALWDRNLSYYQAKWGNWVPHKYRDGIA